LNKDGEAAVGRRPVYILQPDDRRSVVYGEERESEMRKTKNGNEDFAKLTMGLFGGDKIRAVDNE